MRGVNRQRREDRANLRIVVTLHPLQLIGRKFVKIQ